MLRCHFQNFLPHDLSGLKNSVSCHYGTAACESTCTPIELVGITSDNIDLVHRDTKLLGDNLCETGEMTLSLGANSRDNRDTSAAHHLYLRSFVRPDACAFHVCDDADSNVFTFGTQFRLELVDKLVVTNLFESIIQQRLVIPAVVYKRNKILVNDLVIVRKFIGRDEIPPPDFSAVNIQFFSCQVEHPLDDKDPMLPPRTSIRRNDGFIGEDCSKRTVIVLNVVQTEHIGLCIDRDSQAIRIVSASVMEKDIVDTEDVTILVERGLRIVDLAALMCSGDKILGAIFDPFDRAI